MIPLFCREEGVGLIPWSPLARGLPDAAEAGGRDACTRRTPHARDSNQDSPVLYDHPNDWDVVDAVEHNRRGPELSGMSEVGLAWLRLGRPGVVWRHRRRHEDSRISTPALRALELKLTPDGTGGALALVYQASTGFAATVAGTTAGGLVLARAPSECGTPASTRRGDPIVVGNVSDVIDLNFMNVLTREETRHQRATTVRETP